MTATAAGGKNRVTGGRDGVARPQAKHAAASAGLMSRRSRAAASARASTETPGWRAAFVRGGDAGEDELGRHQRGREARRAVDPGAGRLRGARDDALAQVGQQRVERRLLAGDDAAAVEPVAEGLVAVAATLRGERSDVDGAGQHAVQQQRRADETFRPFPAVGEEHRVAAEAGDVREGGHAPDDAEPRASIPAS